MAITLLHAQPERNARRLAGLPELFEAQSILQEVIRRPLVDEEFREPVPVLDQRAGIICPSVRLIRSEVFLERRH
ncbi:hypothetical protein [Mesorhizobium sp. M0898]|uniref:hypothetical protein n=1 Tax=Mesorhizobium sp. M0898 TaxID=2957020 RepID=UPI00333CE662